MAEFTIDQIYTACLSQGSYFIQSGTQAAVIDPLREVDAYINLAHERNADIKYIFETHFHADFVSGHLELAEKTDAPIVFGPNAKPSFEAHVAKDGERFCIGDMTLEVLHTPGHTMESVCYLLRSSDGKEVALFSGDTLFLGDVGRPDVSQISGTMTKEILAESLFDSLHTKLTTLSDDVIVYPGHGAGSACGKSMQKETSDTLGNQRMSNYALRKGITKQEFVSEVLDGLSPAPLYFPSNVSMNQKGYASLDSIWRTALQPLTPIEFEDLALRMNAVILDTRHGDAFSASFIPGAINIGLDGRFAPWAGAVLADVRAPILVVCDQGREKEVATRLARVGFDKIIGYLNGGMDSWLASGKASDSIAGIDPARSLQLIKDGTKLQVIDVRSEQEFESGHLEGASNMPLDCIRDFIQLIDDRREAYLYCAGGYRSMIFSSFLKRSGFAGVVNVSGGYDALKAYL